MFSLNARVAIVTGGGSGIRKIHIPNFSRHRAAPGNYFLKIEEKGVPLENQWMKNPSPQGRLWGKLTGEMAVYNPK